MVSGLQTLLQSLNTGGRRATDILSEIRTMQDYASELFVGDVLVVLSSLLYGRRRVDARRRLIEAGLVPALAKMFDGMDWSNPPKRDPSVVRPLRLTMRSCGADLC